MALTAAFVHGQAAAQAALEYLSDAPRELPEQTQVTRSRDAFFSALKNEEGTSPVDFRKAIQKTADLYAWAVRNRDGLLKALEEVQRLRKVLDKMCLQSKSLNYNLEFIESLQVRNLLDSLELIATGALAREESRGVHYRSDFPQMNCDKFMKNIVLKLGPDGRISINMVPVVTTRLALPVGIHKYGEFSTKIDGFKGS
jgi:succinate dehydrogenase / fumarate reductase flavoprotein subunit